MSLNEVSTANKSEDTVLTFKRYCSPEVFLHCSWKFPNIVTTEHWYADFQHSELTWLAHWTGTQKDIMGPVFDYNHYYNKIKLSV